MYNLLCLATSLILGDIKAARAEIEMDGVRCILRLGLETEAKFSHRAVL